MIKTVFSWWFSLKTKQHYPPGTQESYNSFSLRNLMIGKVRNWNPRRAGRGQQRSPGVPPKTKKKRNLEK
jgi:hypothetical protein